MSWLNILHVHCTFQKKKPTIILDLLDIHFSFEELLQLESGMLEYVDAPLFLVLRYILVSFSTHFDSCFI